MVSTIFMGDPNQQERIHQEGFVGNLKNGIMWLQDGGNLGWQVSVRNGPGVWSVRLLQLLNKLSKERRY